MTIKIPFPEEIWGEVKRWAEPVIETIRKDVVLSQMLKDEEYVSDLVGIASQAYHMNFVDDYDPSIQLDLTSLNKYSPSIRRKTIMALRNGKDICGYIGPCLCD